MGDDEEELDGEAASDDDNGDHLSGDAEGASDEDNAKLPAGEGEFDAASDNGDGTICASAGASIWPAVGLATMARASSIYATRTPCST